MRAAELNVVCVAKLTSYQCSSRNPSACTERAKYQSSSTVLSSEGGK
jgi:hypothetical protein